MTKKEIYIFAISLICIPYKSFSYPQFVGFGYTSCLTCHYNPYGSGPLNDYGRALSATAISARAIYPDYFDEEEVANKSGFLFTTPKNNWFRPSFDYRGLLLKRDFNRDTEQTEYINMMADLNFVFKTANNKLYTSTTIGYAPTPAHLKNSDEKVDNYLIREAYVGYRFGDKWGIYYGIMDKIFGIRVAEHTSYSRQVANLSHNDQSNGVQLHYIGKNLEVGVGAFMGKPAEEDQLKQVGGSVKIDYVISHKGTVGVSALRSKSEFLETYMAAFHVKTAAGKGASFLAEVGNVKRKAVVGDIEQSNTYSFLQASLNPSRGLYILNTVEYLNSQDQQSYRIRFGPGIQYFPFQRVELRLDLYNTRNFSELSSSRDTIDLLTQLHLWF